MNSLLNDWMNVNIGLLIISTLVSSIQLYHYIKQSNNQSIDEWSNEYNQPNVVFNMLNKQSMQQLIDYDQLIPSCLNQMIHRPLHRYKYVQSINQMKNFMHQSNQTIKQTMHQTNLHIVASIVECQALYHHHHIPYQSINQSRSGVSQNVVQLSHHLVHR